MRLKPKFIKINDKYFKVKLNENITKLLERNFTMSPNF